MTYNDQRLPLPPNDASLTDKIAHHLREALHWDHWASQEKPGSQEYFELKDKAATHYLHVRVMQSAQELMEQGDE